MNIVIKGTNLELHDELKEYVNEKIGGLRKFMEEIDFDDSSVIARVELAKTTNHHQRGDVYRAEVNLDMPKKLIRSSVESDDIHKAIDQVKDELRMSVSEYKNEKVNRIRKDRKIVKDLRNISPLAWAKNEFRKIIKKK